MPYLPRTRLALVSVSLAAVAALVGRWSSPAGAMPAPEDGDDAPSVGPDVIVGALHQIAGFGTVNGVSAYAVGTISCNIGDELVLWCNVYVPDICTRDQHPVVAQNLYRLSGGRLEQIGMSWAKHGFCALSETLCGTCIPDPYACQTLGIGCADPYDALLNGTQNNLGPRSQVDASTGALVYPFSAPPPPPTIGRRLQVSAADLNPAQNGGAVYFAEGLFVAGDDAAAGNALNNASYRRAVVGGQQGAGWKLSLDGPTYQQKPAIYAWREHGLGMDMPDPSVQIVEVDVADDGRLIVASKATQLSASTWRYDYALCNLNSDRAVGAWTIHLPPGVVATNLLQRLVAHHSGEIYSTAAWSAESSCGEVRWHTEPYATNANANALRWGVTFSFGFESTRPPASSAATLGLFKPGAAGDPTIAVVAPAPLDAGDADLNGDGLVDSADLGLLLAKWGGSGEGDLDGSGEVDSADLGLLLSAWLDC